MKRSLIYHEWTYSKGNFLGQREIKPVENLEFKNEKQQKWQICGSVNRSAVGKLFL